jgi:proline iminopeptidase
MAIYKEWYLRVSETDEIYYECKWKITAKPILYLHWWPWYGLSGREDAYFELDKNNVIFFDQRRCWRSIFTGKNLFKWLDTEAMIHDIVSLIDYLWIDTVSLVWGSWWSTLALNFAFIYPERVDKILFTWVYLPAKSHTDEFLYWNGITLFFPDAWEKLLQVIPEKMHTDNSTIFSYIRDEAQKGNYEPIWELHKFERNICKLDWKWLFLSEPDDKQRAIKASLIELHFIRNWCFLEKNYLEKNAHRLDNIDVSIIQWRYDMICSSGDAWKLHKAIPKSTLQFTIWWHTQSDEDTCNAMKITVQSFFYNNNKS